MQRNKSDFWFISAQCIAIDSVPFTEVLVTSTSELMGFSKCLDLSKWLFCGAVMASAELWPESFPWESSEWKQLDSTIHVGPFQLVIFYKTMKVAFSTIMPNTHPSVFHWGLCSLSPWGWFQLRLWSLSLMTEDLDHLLSEHPGLMF